MNNDIRNKLRDFFKQKLRIKDEAALKDSDSLFISGLLDSLDTVETIIFLEKEFGVSFAESGFDKGSIDSINDIISFIENSKMLKKDKI